MSLRRISLIYRKIVGSLATTRKFDSKSAPQLPLQFKIISTWSSPWHIWLQQNTAGPTWNQSPILWEDNQLSHLGTLWHIWMAHWHSFRTLVMCGMLHPINTYHNNCRYSWIHFHSYPYSQEKFRGLSPSIHHRHSLSLGIPKADYSLHFICRWYTKCSKTDRHTPQPLYTRTKYYQEKNHSYLPSAYISIGTNSKSPVIVPRPELSPGVVSGTESVPRVTVPA